MSEDSAHQTIVDEIRLEARERAKDAAIPRIAPYPLGVVDAQFLETSIDSQQRIFTITRNVLTLGTISYQYLDNESVVLGFELRALAIDITAISIHLAPFLQSEELDTSSLVGGALLFAESIIDRIEQREKDARNLLVAQRPKNYIRHTITSPLNAVSEQDTEAILQFVKAKRGADESELTKWVREELLNKQQPYKDVQNAFLIKTKVDMSDPRKKKVGRDNFSRIVRRIKERTTAH